MAAMAAGPVVAVVVAAVATVALLLELAAMEPTAL
jgi:hypothetical protein